MLAFAPIFLALCCTPILAQGTSSDGERPSLEAFRRQLIVRRDQARAELKSDIEDKLGQLRTLVATSVGSKQSAGFRSKLESLRSAFDALPKEAAPLLVSKLGIDFNNTEDGAPIAETLYRALLSIGTRGITTELADLARSGQPLASRYAIELLARSGAPLDAEFELLQLWKDPPEHLESAIAEAILELGTPSGFEQLAQSLLDNRSARIAWVLSAMVKHPSPLAEVAVAEFLQGHSPALHKNIDYVIAFYRTRPKAFGEELARALILELSNGVSPIRTDREILEALPELKRQSDPDWMASLRTKLRTKIDAEYERALLVCLALCGDNKVRKALLSESESELRELKKNHKSEIREAAIRRNRGQLYLELKEFDRAAKEFGEAFKLYPNAWKEQLSCGIDQARANVLGNHIRKAYSQLKALKLSATQRKQCADDPDFSELLNSAQYGEILKPR